MRLSVSVFVNVRRRNTVVACVFSVFGCGGLIYPLMQMLLFTVEWRKCYHFFPPQVVLYTRQSFFFVVVALISSYLSLRVCEA